MRGVTAAAKSAGGGERKRPRCVGRQRSRNGFLPSAAREHAVVGVVGLRGDDLIAGVAQGEHRKKGAPRSRHGGDMDYRLR